MPVFRQFCRFTRFALISSVLPNRCLTPARTPRCFRQGGVPGVCACVSPLGMLPPTPHPAAWVSRKSDHSGVRGWRERVGLILPPPPPQPPKTAGDPRGRCQPAPPAPPPAPAPHSSHGAEKVGQDIKPEGPDPAKPAAGFRRPSPPSSPPKTSISATRPSRLKRLIPPPPPPFPGSPRRGSGESVFSR